MINIMRLENIYKFKAINIRRILSSRCELAIVLISLFLTSAPAAAEPDSLQIEREQRDSHRAAIGQLLDGLHRAAAESDAQDYFARYTEEAVFLGTDASERWSIAEFKAYAAKPFAEGRGWRYDVVSRHLVPTGNPEIYGFDEVLRNEKLGLCRGSGLVVFDGARWRVVQYVLSMLIPNAIAESVGRETVKALEQGGQ
jgi:hypothetical protein